ncbi:hypothetical protein OVY01_11640 [Robbsia sp. Bb-Pol-6]|uniref:Lipoprotein n=1 Tax=Robbsia betulipollinis TaxID=2981849 RepID=A0ABT3ZMU3_9BURK|nr:hypothetical protein [Robbsia betulipollinis]MCY0387876.1 hypothetical protein [Robbsia betulipollinis]
MTPVLAAMRATSRTGSRLRTAAFALTVLAGLAGCAAPPLAPDGTILSRLPADAPGAAASSAIAPLPDADEQARRYDQIDRQALQDSENAIRADAAARAASALAAQSPLYYGDGYGGYGWTGPAFYGWGGPAFYCWGGPGWYGYGYGYGPSGYGGGWRGPRSGVFIGRRWGR